MIDPTERRMECLERELAVAKRKYTRACVSMAEARAEAKKWRTIAGDYTDTEPFPWEVTPKRSIHDVPFAIDIPADTEGGQ
jgi:hypothetical protein